MSEEGRLVDRSPSKLYLCFSKRPSHHLLPPAKHQGPGHATIFALSTPMPILRSQPLACCTLEGDLFILHVLLGDCTCILHALSFMGLSRTAYCTE